MHRVAPQGLSRATLRYPDLDVQTCRRVGWGAGGQFRRYYPRLAIEVDYTICIDPQNIGTTVCGVPVFDQSRLLAEDPTTTLVIVFSNWWYEIFRQIAALGPYRMVRAFSHDSFDAWTTQLEATSGSAQNSRDRCGHGDQRSQVGIVVQGPLLPAVSRNVLALNRANFPGHPIVLSTWVDSDRALLAECAPYVDRVVLSQPPAEPGVVNVRLQQVSTLAGLQALADSNVEYAIKTRTDQSLCGQLQLDPILRAIEEPIATSAPRALCGRRILFDGRTTMRFVPYHLSDQLHVGALVDLVALWSFDYSEAFGHERVVSGDDPMTQYALLTIESSIIRSFLRRLGHDPHLRVEAYWRILLGSFGILPEDELRQFNWKAVPLFDIDVRLELDPADLETMPLFCSATYAWFTGLQRSPDHHFATARALERADYRIQDLWVNRRIRLTT